MTIIVTGGAGFIGSNFIFYMLDKHPEDQHRLRGQADLRRQPVHAGERHGQAQLPFREGGHL